MPLGYRLDSRLGRRKRLWPGANEERAAKPVPGEVVEEEDDRIKLCARMRPGKFPTSSPKKFLQAFLMSSPVAGNGRQFDCLAPLRSRRSGGFGSMLDWTRHQCMRPPWTCWNFLGCPENGASGCGGAWEIVALRSRALPVKTRMSDAVPRASTRRCRRARQAGA